MPFSLSLSPMEYAHGISLAKMKLEDLCPCFKVSDGVSDTTLVHSSLDPLLLLWHRLFQRCLVFLTCKLENLPLKQIQLLFASDNASNAAPIL